MRLNLIQRYHFGRSEFLIELFYIIICIRLRIFFISETVLLSSFNSFPTLRYTALVIGWLSFCVSEFHLLFIL